MIEPSRNGFHPESFRSVPQDTEAEKYVLGAIFCDPSILHEIALILRPDDFFREIHGQIFAIMLKLAAQSLSIDPVSISDAMGKRLGVRDSAWDDLLGDLFHFAPHSLGAVSSATIVRRKSKRRQIILMCQETERDARQGDDLEGGDTDALTSRASEALMKISDQDAAGTTLNAFQSVQNTVKAFDDRLAGAAVGLITGYTNFDNMVDGLRPGKLIVMAGRPGSGKTAAALNICQNVMDRMGAPVLFFSMEMDHQSLINRLASATARINGKQINRPKRMKDSEVAAYRGATSYLEQTGLYIDDSPVRNLTQIEANSRLHRMRHGIELVVIDYIQLIDAQPERGESRQEQVARISRRLKAIARSLAIPVIVLAQLNRNSEKREDRRPKLEDLRESGQIEADADLVVLLHRAELHNPNDHPGEAEWIVAKNRDGETGSVPMTYLKEFTRFESRSNAERNGDY